MLYNIVHIRLFSTWSSIWDMSVISDMSSHLYPRNPLFLSDLPLHVSLQHQQQIWSLQNVSCSNCGNLGWNKQRISNIRLEFNTLNILQKLSR